MESIFLKHLSGAKANQIEEISLKGFTELTFGRDSSSSVVYQNDGKVSRRQAKIIRDPSAPTQFLIIDLNSRNGTYINKNRIEVSRLAPGDVIQFGVGGPEFEFHTEPPVEELTQAIETPTLAVDSATMPLGQEVMSRTRSMEAPPTIPVTSSSAVPIPPPPAATFPPPGRIPVAKVAARPSNKSRKYLIAGGAVLATIVVAFAVYLTYRIFTEEHHTVTDKQPAGDKANKKDASTDSGKNSGAKTGETAEKAESDPERTSWRIDVAPFATLGSGHPGKAASDFDKPDGVAFAPSGLLFATDAKNRRVQIWDVKTHTRLGEFGHGVFGGEIVDVAVTSEGTVYVTDQTLNLAYVFEPPKPGELDEKKKPLGPYDYQFRGTRFGEQKFDKLGGIAIDSKNRVYVVDAHLNDVRRFNPDGTVDRSWRFDRMKSDGDTHLHGCEGIAIDEANGNLFIASEKDSVVEVFDLDSGAYKRQLVGASQDSSDKPAGKHVFFGSVEGLTLVGHYLLAVDEGAGHIQIFDTSQQSAFNTDLSGYASTQQNRSGGYKGFFGHSPTVNFEDKTNLALQQQLKDGSIIPGQANAPGYFCSPDAIASYKDEASGETYIAIADQCNYRLAVYRWSDISRSLGQPVAVASEPKSSASNETSKVSAAPPIVPLQPKPIIRRESSVSRRAVKVSRSPVTDKKSSKKNEKDTSAKKRKSKSNKV
jgi:pSer/pThr/pTyr-binding forkhead associated (FHA) protein